jgi:hypothetical protein
VDVVGDRWWQVVFDFGFLILDFGLGFRTGLRRCALHSKMRSLPRKCASWKTSEIRSKMRTLFQGAHQNVRTYENTSLENCGCHGVPLARPGHWGRLIKPGARQCQCHPTALTLAFGLEGWPTPSREDVRELKRRNGAKFADSEGGCPRLSIISRLHPRTADRREAPALAAVVPQINSRTSSREVVVVFSSIAQSRGRGTPVRTLSVFIAEKRVNGVECDPISEGRHWRAKALA